MPNQNDPTQNSSPANPAASPPVPPVIFPQSDLPPLPPEFQNLSKNDEPTAPLVSPPEEKSDEPKVNPPINSDTGSSTPPDISSVIPKAKKKFGGGKIIATILGLVVLVGGIGAGILLTQQKQLFQQKASGPSGCLCPVPNPQNIPCIESNGINYVDLQRQAGCAYCNWSWEGGACCPGGGDSCSPVASIRCVPSPQVQECKQYSPYCSKGVWQPIAYYGTVPELCADSRCGNEDFCTPPTNPPTAPPTVSPTPTVTPTSTPSGPNLCSISTVDKTTLAPGESVVMSSVSNSSTNNFTYAVYNVDNPYNPNNPKPVCVTSGGDVTTERDTCPAGTYHLIFKDTNTDARTAGSTTVEYGKLFVVDKNWSDKQVTRVQINAYFQVTGDQVSTPQPACVAWVTTTTTAPSCIAVKAYNSDNTTDNTGWIFIPKEQLPSLAVGATVNFCVSGNAASGTFDKAQFMINTILKAEVITHARPDSNDFCQAYTILSTDTTIEVKASIHHSNGTWYGDVVLP